MAFYHYLPAVRLHLCKFMYNDRFKHVNSRLVIAENLFTDYSHLVPISKFWQPLWLSLMISSKTKKTKKKKKEHNLHEALHSSSILGRLVCQVQTDLRTAIESVRVLLKRLQLLIYINSLIK